MFLPLALLSSGFMYPRVFLKQATSLQGLKLLYISLVHDQQNQHESRDSLFLSDLMLRCRAHVREAKKM
jgi:hypothetical protein